MEDNSRESAAVAEFRVFEKDADTAVAVAAIRSLTGVMKRSVATTLMGLQKELETAAQELRSVDPTISLISGTELFLRFVTRAGTGTGGGFEEVKAVLLDRAEKFLERSVVARNTIGKIVVERFLADGMKLLVHGLSRVVLEFLRQAAELGRRLTIYVTECRTVTRCWGADMANRITEVAGYDVNLVLDSTVGRIMNEVDLVVFGAEGVVENGGIINTVGTYQIAIVANLHNVPVYVVAESFKFVRHFPLSQNDVPQFRDVSILEDLQRVTENDAVKVVTHTHDYTPPKFISLLFTDLGILTPAAVSDQLIKLYM